MQRIFIDLGIVPHPARGALSGDARPSVAGILGTQLDTVVHFFRNATQEALAASSSGKLTLKAPGALAGAALFLDTTMTASGSGAATIYQFSGILSSEELVEDLGELESKTYRCCVSWTEPGEPEDKCLDFDLVVWNSSARPEDVMPANADAFWEAIKTVAPEANGFTHDDETKTLAVDAGGAPDAHAASHAAAGSDPLTLAQSQVTDLVTDLAAKVPVTRTINGQALSGNVTLAKADLGLGNVENTSDAGKPISTATQTALDAKAPLANPTFTGTVTLPAAQISSANLRNSTAYSVIGRSSNSNGVPADIVAGNNGVLCRNGSGALAFSIPSLSGGNFQGILPLSRGGLGESITDPASTQMLKAVGVLVVTVNAAAQDATLSGWGGDLASTYFDLSTVDTTYRFWFNTGSNSAPGDGGHTLVEVATIDPPNDFASALNAISGGAAFSAFYTGTDVSIIWIVSGAVTAPEMTNASPLSVTVNTAGADEVLALNPEILSRLPA